MSPLQAGRRLDCHPLSIQLLVNVSHYPSFFSTNINFDSVNAHAEELRSYFVAYEGKEELMLYDVGDQHTMDLAKVSRMFCQLLDKHVSPP